LPPGGNAASGIQPYLGSARHRSEYRDTVHQIVPSRKSPSGKYHTDCRLPDCRTLADLSGGIGPGFPERRIWTQMGTSPQCHSRHRPRPKHDTWNDSHPRHNRDRVLTVNCVDNGRGSRSIGRHTTGLRAARSLRSGTRPFGLRTA
jgi:hypothetical protein